MFVCVYIPNRRSALSNLVGGKCRCVCVCFPSQPAISFKQSCRWDICLIYIYVIISFEGGMHK